jgi:hypothetical protein
MLMESPNYEAPKVEELDTAQGTTETAAGLSGPD